MSQRQDLGSTTMETAQETLEFPMNQAIEYQRTLAELVLNNLTMGDWLQSRGIEITKRAFRNYLQTLEATRQGFSEGTMAGMNATQQAGQSMMGTAQRGQEGPTGIGGPGQQARGTGQTATQYQQGAAGQPEYYPQPGQGAQQPTAQPMAQPTEGQQARRQQTVETQGAPPSQSVAPTQGPGQPIGQETTTQAGQPPIGEEVQQEQPQEPQ